MLAKLRSGFTGIEILVLGALIVSLITGTVATSDTARKFLFKPKADAPSQCSLVGDGNQRGCWCAEGGWQFHCFDPNTELPPNADFGLCETDCRNRDSNNAANPVTVPETREGCAGIQCGGDTCDNGTAFSGDSCDTNHSSCTQRAEDYCKSIGSSYKSSTTTTAPTDKSNICESNGLSCSGITVGSQCAGNFDGSCQKTGTNSSGNATCGCVPDSPSAPLSPPSSTDTGTCTNIPGQSCAFNLKNCQDDSGVRGNGSCLPSGYCCKTKTAVSSQICTPNSFIGCDDLDKQKKMCNSAGTGYVYVSCDFGQKCDYAREKCSLAAPPPTTYTCTNTSSQKCSATCDGGYAYGGVGTCQTGICCKLKPPPAPPTTFTATPYCSPANKDLCGSKCIVSPTGGSCPATSQPPSTSSACAPGEYSCNGNTLEYCYVSGAPKTKIKDCPTGQICDLQSPTRCTPTKPASPDGGQAAPFKIGDICYSTSICSSQCPDKKYYFSSTDNIWKCGTSTPVPCSTSGYLCSSNNKSLEYCPALGANRVKIKDCPNGCDSTTKDCRSSSTGSTTTPPVTQPLTPPDLGSTCSNTDGTKLDNERYCCDNKVQANPACTTTPQGQNACPANLYRCSKDILGRPVSQKCITNQGAQSWSIDTTCESGGCNSSSGQCDTPTKSCSWFKSCGPGYYCNQDTLFICKPTKTCTIVGQYCSGGEVFNCTSVGSAPQSTKNCANGCNDTRTDCKPTAPIIKPSASDIQALENAYLNCQTDLACANILDELKPLVTSAELANLQAQLLAESAATKPDISTLSPCKPNLSCSGAFPDGRLPYVRGANACLAGDTPAICCPSGKQLNSNSTACVDTPGIIKTLDKPLEIPKYYVGWQLRRLYPSDKCLPEVCNDRTLYCYTSKSSCENAYPDIFKKPAFGVELPTFCSEKNPCSNSLQYCNGKYFKTCQLKKAPGENCSENKECLVGFKCANNTCQPELNWCKYNDAVMGVFTANCVSSSDSFIGGMDGGQKCTPVLNPTDTWTCCSPEEDLTIKGEYEIGGSNYYYCSQRP